MCIQIKDRNQAPIAFTGGLVFRFYQLSIFTLSVCWYLHFRCRFRIWFLFWRATNSFINFFKKRKKKRIKSTKNRIETRNTLDLVRVWTYMSSVRCRCMCNLCILIIFIFGLVFCVLRFWMFAIRTFSILISKCVCVCVSDIYVSMTTYDTFLFLQTKSNDK